MAYAGDPRWIVSRYPGHCRDCEQPIGRGERILYWPGRMSGGRHGRGDTYCARCGEPRYARFAAEAADEDVYAGTW